MALVDSSSYSCSNSISNSRQRSWLNSNIHDPALNYKENDDHSSRLTDVNLSSDLEGLRIEGLEALESFNNFDALSLTLNTDILNATSHGTYNQLPFDPLSATNPSHTIAQPFSASKQTPRRPFQRWMRSLHRRAVQRPSVWASHGVIPRNLLDSEDVGRASISRNLGHRPSSSGSSFGFITAVRSASASLASVSAVTRSRRKTRSRISKTDRSSRPSLTLPRMSEDSFGIERSPSIDVAAIGRALQRRRILEEIISTEEGYIGDIRFLINVYITILASLPTVPKALRASINRNLNDIVELHDELLGELHRAIPFSEYNQVDLPTPVATGAAQSHSHSYAKAVGHRRWRSLDAVPEHSDGVCWLQATPGMLADAQVGAEVAKIFGKRMNRFFVYKEYGAKYETMIRDIGSATRSMPEWDMYQKGLEALALTLDSAKTNDDKSRKSLTIGDLLVKPIQRVCKYPLLFAELLKYTPVCDCPNSHMEIDSTLARLRETTAEINRATNDDQMKAVLEKTWLLQDRLMFPGRKLDSAARSQIRSLGHIELCGSLYACWQTKDGVDGRYLACLLYRDVLLLAEAGQYEQVYTIAACINLNYASIEEVDNGRGLQCNTAPFSWKLVFVSDYQLYEMIMSACSAKEEMEWRARLSKPRRGTEEAKDPNLYTSLDLNLKSLGTVFGKPGTVVRRLSIQRAATVGPNSPLCQVVLRNTTAGRDTAKGSSTNLNISRSPSLMTTTTRLPILAPARAERARLENLLQDVWSRDVLPFPGMGTRSRSEQLVRNASSTMMRKLSVASITGSFGRRSRSMSRQSRPDDDVNTRETTKDSKAKQEDSMCAVQSFKAGVLRPGKGAGALKDPTVDEEASNGSGTVRRFHPVEIVGSYEELFKSFPGSSPLAQTASATSGPLSSSMHPVRSKKSMAWAAEKENQMDSVQETSLHTRWDMHGVPRADGKVHSLRRLFR